MIGHVLGAASYFFLHSQNISTKKKRHLSSLYLSPLWLCRWWKFSLISFAFVSGSSFSCLIYVIKNHRGMLMRHWVKPAASFCFFVIPFWLICFRKLYTCLALIWEPLWSVETIFHSCLRCACDCLTRWIGKHFSLCSWE